MKKRKMVQNKMQGKESGVVEGGNQRLSKSMLDEALVFLQVSI